MESISPNIDISKLTEADRKDLSRTLANESQKMNMQQTVHNLSEICWKKCIAGGNITSNRLDSSEERCAQNCVERWMDANFLILKHLETLRGQS
ncbi:hypothetical protein VTN31DRAFT_7348 [Thermomyces dupontii]|uniref:uncharacterized protein n=1 Tax=Talaromyces thermophilus TaxID=28565 RepID=UPI003742AE7A